jgi:hypothetical protein
MEALNDVADQRLAIEGAQGLVAAAHAAGKTTRQDDARYLLHLFLPGAFASMTGFFFLNGVNNPGQR